MRICEYEMCDREAVRRGYCWGHNQQLKEGRPLKPLRAYSKSASPRPDDDADGLKWCCDCGEFKVIGEFGKNAARKDGLAAYCRDCLNRRGRRSREKPGAAPIRAESKRQWRARNKERTRAASIRNGGKRRARLKGASAVPFTAEQLAQKMSYYGNRCFFCSAPAVEVDHFKPLSKGGAHILSNLRPICKECNCKKSNKWPIFGLRIAVGLNTKWP